MPASQTVNRATVAIAAVAAVLAAIQGWGLGVLVCLLVVLLAGDRAVGPRA